MREFSNRSCSHGDFAIVVPVHRVGTYCKPYHRTCAWPSSIGHSILKLPATLSPKISRLVLPNHPTVAIPFRQPPSHKRPAKVGIGMEFRD